MMIPSRRPETGFHVNSQRWIQDKGSGGINLVGISIKILSIRIIETFAKPAGDGSLHIGYAPCRALRCDYYGVDAWLIVMSTEFLSHAVETLERTASGSLAPAGHYALEALRVRAGMPALPRDLDDQVSTRETVKTKLVRLSMASTDVPLYGGEGILRDGKTVGQTTSGHWQPFTGEPGALGFVSDDEGIDQSWIAAGRFEIDAPGGPYPASCALLIGQA